MQILTPDNTDNLIKKIVEETPEGIRFKDLIVKTELNTSTLRYRCFELAVAGQLRIERQVERGHISLIVYPITKAVDAQ